MEFSFDIRGYLKPYGKNKITIEQLETEFVAPFDEPSTRHQLYTGYIHYNKNLKELLKNQKYTQWIDGSFISNKINPKDIDLVNLIDSDLVDQHEKELKQFLNHQGKENYGVDGYVVRIYPEEHAKYIRTQSDLLYWEHWFSKSRKNRRKQRFPKGFVELEF
ncbi:MAG: hypothetical protein AAGG68_12610 [Bacteroidota bacterium]